MVLSVYCGYSRRAHAAHAHHAPMGHNHSASCEPTQQASDHSTTIVTGPGPLGLKWRISAARAVVA